MVQLPLARAYIIGPVFILLIGFICWIASPWSFDHLAYQREAVIQGQWWRLISANLTHSNFMHLGLNALGVFTIWALYGDEYKTRKYFTLIVVFSLACTVSMHFLNPERINYVGLSGVLHGLFAWGVIQDINRRYITGWLLLIGLTIKIVHEQLQGGSAEIALLIEARVATEAHLYGTIAGLITGLWDVYKSRTRASSPVSPH
ncbi:rhombosortase [Alteromonas sp. a30]|uniref:rhombosortase n=1 Tax=Alteromonas sp. a30 TaxID=2730917 RepID=UPI00227DCC62|nr:rhombosortase [Alteromonas sp. a30]MCY7297005.1 rhombosortase [Alteromonas sp. a30]